MVFHNSNNKKSYRPNLRWFFLSLFSCLDNINRAESTSSAIGCCSNPNISVLNQQCSALLIWATYTQSVPISHSQSLLLIRNLMLEMQRVGASASLYKAKRELGLHQPGQEGTANVATVFSKTSIYQYIKCESIENRKRWLQKMSRLLPDVFISLEHFLFFRMTGMYFTTVPWPMA